jgi:hypothetical protein
LRGVVVVKVDRRPFQNTKPHRFWVWDSERYSTKAAMTAADGRQPEFNQEGVRES